jgi:hypothetical protein
MAGGHNAEILPMNRSVGMLLALGDLEGHAG